MVHAKKPTVAYYRSLYDAVGRDYDWTSRKKLSDAELAALLNDPRLEVHVLTADGVPAGLAELDRRVEGEIELVQFGLLPEFIGQGLGRYFLRWATDKAWGYVPRRFWLHTCTKDHPAALGIARTVPACRYTADRAAAELRHLLDNPVYHQRASEIGEQVRKEDGVRAACDALEALFQT